MSPKSFNLLQYHQRLDRQIRTEFQKHWPDIMRIHRLRKLKLAVRARLNRLATGNRRGPAI